MTGTIIDYGPDGEPGGGDDVTYTIDQWSEWISADLTVYTASVEVRRRGSGDDYASTATVAAGGYGTDVHKADVRVSTHPAVPGGTALDIAVAIKDGQGGGKPGTGGAASLSMNSYTADAEGRIHGTFTSSNQLESVTIECQDGEGEPIAGFGAAVVAQAWHHGNVVFLVPYFFVPGFADDMKFDLRLEDGAPIDGHAIEWFSPKITLDWFYWNLDSGDWGWGVADFSHPYEGEEALPFGLSSDDLVEYAENTVEGPAGTYVNSQTVWDYFDLVEIEGEEIWQEALVLSYAFIMYETKVFAGNP